MTNNVIPILAGRRPASGDAASQQSDEKGDVNSAPSPSPATAPASPRILTQSELAAFDRCERKWWLGWYRKLRRRDVFDRLPGIGTFVHAGLEAYYDGRTRDPLEVVRERATATIENLPEHAEAIADAAGLAGIMLEGYMEWLHESGEDVGLMFDGAERKVEAALKPSPYILRGKIDATFVRERDGARVQLEHKTVGNLTDLPKIAQANFQFLTYDLLAYLKAMEGDGTRTDGVLLNMLRRVKRTAQAKPPFYKRHEVRHNTQELRNHWKHVVELARRQDAAIARLDAGEDHHNAAPKSWERSCSYSCDFYAVCPLLDDGSDAEGFLAAEYEEHDPLERYEEIDPE